MTSAQNFSTAASAAFTQRLLRVAPQNRDAWVNRLLGLDALPDDGDDLPRGCTPYLPSSVATLLRTVERAAVTNRDVFVDVGSGVGRALALVHLLTGAGAVGLEIQAGLAGRAKRLAEARRLERVRTVQGDAESLVRYMVLGSVFFFYCPFGGTRLSRVLDALSRLARVRPLRLCFVDMPAPKLPWLAEDPSARGEALAICRTQLHTELGARAATTNSATLAALSASSIRR